VVPARAHALNGPDHLAGHTSAVSLASGVLVALLLLVIPGAIIARAAQLTWPVAVAVGPALTYGTVALAILPLGAVGIPWNLWTALLALPAVVLIAFGFASLGMGITSYMKTFQQMDWINFVMLPMFLFSTTFYPLSTYPGPLQVVVRCTPLYHGIELIRRLVTGDVGWSLLGNAAYLAVLDQLRTRSPLVLGGRSAGARSACRIARDVGARGVLALSFPLHPPGRPEKSRLEELRGVRLPTLVIQGEKDPFGTPEEFPDGIELAVVPEADHSMKVAKRASVSQADALAVVLEATLEWVVREVAGNPGG